MLVISQNVKRSKSQKGRAKMHTRDCGEFIVTIEVFRSYRIADQLATNSHGGPAVVSEDKDYC